MASTRKPAAKAKPKTGGAKRPAAKKTDLDRRWSILLFGLGLFFVVLSLVPGESGWAWLRSWVLFGTFGLGGWFLGPLIIYWAVLVSLEKPVFPAIIKGVLLLLAICGAALVFGGVDLKGLTFGEALAALIENGRSGYGGGLLSVFFGASLLALVGVVGARILMVLVVLIAVMVIAGVTPGDIVRFFSGMIRRARERREAAGYYDEEEPYEEEPAPAPKPAPARNGNGRQNGNGRRAPAAAMAQPAAAQRRIGTVDLPLTDAEARRQNGGRRRVTLDIDLGPDPAPAPGGAEQLEETIGPGGTFGLDAVQAATGSKAAQAGGEDSEFGIGDYEPIIPFGGGAAPRPAKPAGADGGLLFGEHDPYAALGGADSRLPLGALTNVEYIEPEPDPEFDLFGRPAPLPGQQIFDYDAQDGPGAEAAGAPAKPVDPMIATVMDAAEASFSRPAHQAERGGDTLDDAPPFDVDDAAGGAPGMAGVPTGAGVTPDVDAMIEKAAARKVEEKAVLGDQRGGGTLLEPYRFPPMNLFAVPPAETSAGAVEERKAREEMKNTADLLVSTLASFGVQTRILDVSRGPSVTRYEIQPQAGVKISRITGLADDIALNLAAAGVRIEAPIPGKPAVGIEVPNKVKSTVVIRSIFESEAFAGATTPLPMALGKDIAGDVVVGDLTKMPHLLIAGSTGSGKSVCINAIIMSFLYKSSPEDVRLILIDPKVVELAEYNGIPHLLIPVVTEPRQAAKALGHAVAMMERRYHTFAENSVRDIKTYNKLAARDGTLEHMPHIAIVIDELADLMMTAGKDVENFICRIAQKARAAGMHLIVATQRPSVDVITGLIKSNIPSRIAFAVSSQVDSRTILDGAGAEKLLGMGDMLYMPVGANKPVRIQGTYVKDGEISKVLRFVKENSAAAYDEDVLAEMENVQLSGQKNDPGDDAGEADAASLLSDPTFQNAVDMALDAGEISTSGLQRRLRLGYARAGRIVDQMEQLHIVSEPNGSKPRQVLISRSQWQEMVMNNGEG